MDPLMVPVVIMATSSFVVDRTASKMRNVSFK
jgi:hypothetical protein